MPNLKILHKRPQAGKRSPVRVGLALGAVLGLALLLTGALSGLPPASDPHSILLTHVSARYLERGRMETGQPFALSAVFSDYRSGDLAILSLLFLSASLHFFAAGAAAFRRRHSKAGEALAWALAGPLLCWGLGFLCLMGGSNLFDDEGLALPVAPDQARAAGSLLMVLGVLAAFLSFWRRFRPGPGGEE